MIYSMKRMKILRQSNIFQKFLKYLLERSEASNGKMRVLKVCEH